MFATCREFVSCGCNRELENDSPPRDWSERTEQAMPELQVGFASPKLLFRPACLMDNVEVTSVKHFL